MFSKIKMLVIAASAGPVLGACAEEPPVVDFEALNAQMAQFQELRANEIFCDERNRAAFADFVTLYSNGQLIRGKAWPDLSGDHGAPNWMTKTSLSGAIAGYIPAEKFARGRSAVRNMLGDIEHDATRNRPKAQQMASVFGNSVITPLAKEDVEIAAKVACTSLVDYAGEMTEAQYIKDFAFGPLGDHSNDEIQAAIRQYNRHIGRMMDLKEPVLNALEVAKKG